MAESTKPQQGREEQAGWMTQTNALFTEDQVSLERSPVPAPTVAPTTPAAETIDQSTRRRSSSSGKERIPRASDGAAPC